ncbi:MAG: ParB/RepB/Spo0J family partition protein [Candidatus Heimdallarchaeota archaeon]
MSETITKIKLSKIKPAKRQLRKDFDEEKVRELAESIESTGLIQPILVRQSGNNFEIISGHRRVEAFRKLKKSEIPAIIRDLDNGTAFETAIVENLQRDDLSPLEEAEAFKALIDQLSYTQDRIAKKIGKTQSYVNARLQILDTSEKIQEDFQKGELSITHIKAIKSLKEPEEQEKFVEFIKEKEIGPTRATKISTEVKRVERELEEKGIDLIKFKTDNGQTVFDQVLDKAYKNVESPQEAIEEFSIDQSMFPLIDSKLLPPLKEQLHKKMLWNLARLSRDDNFDFFTTGSSQKDPEYIVELMKVVDASTLIDIRKNAKSIFRPEFNDNALEFILKDAGLTYLHWPEYGVPRLIRNQLSSNKITLNEFFKHYDEEILKPELVKKLQKEIEKCGKIVFLCSEVNPEDCHRHRVALALEAKGLNSLDL